MKQVGRGAPCCARAISALLLATLLSGADLDLGSKVYEEKCANQYCHGSAGEAGPAPRLAGRGLRGGSVTRPVVRGIPRTNMPAWEKVLETDELNAVIDYVLSIQNPVRLTEVRPEVLDPNRASLAHPGRELFFDAGRVGSCGNCHEFDGLGVAVAAPIERAPESVDWLRTLQPRSVVTVTPTTGGEQFVGLDADEDGSRSRFVDLRPRLPVLRSFSENAVNVEPGGEWTHEAALLLYSEGELGRILDYLRIATE